MKRRKREKKFIGAILSAVGGIANGIIGGISKHKQEVQQKTQEALKTSNETVSNMDKSINNNEIEDIYNNKLIFKGGGKIMKRTKGLQSYYNSFIQGNIPLPNDAIKKAETEKQIKIYRKVASANNRANAQYFIFDPITGKRVSDNIASDQPATPILEKPQRPKNYRIPNNNIAPDMEYMFNKPRTVFEQIPYNAKDHLMKDSQGMANGAREGILQNTISDLMKNRKFQLGGKNRLINYYKSKAANNSKKMSSQNAPYRVGDQVSTPPYSDNRNKTNYQNIPSLDDDVVRLMKIKKLDTSDKARRKAIDIITKHNNKDNMNYQSGIYKK